MLPEHSKNLTFFLQSWRIYTRPTILPTTLAKCLAGIVSSSDIPLHVNLLLSSPRLRAPPSNGISVQFWKRVTQTQCGFCYPCSMWSWLVQFLNPHGPIPDPQGPIQEPHGPTSDPHGPIPDCHGPISDPHGQIPDPHGLTMWADYPCSMWSWLPMLNGEAGYPRSMWVWLPMFNVWLPMLHVGQLLLLIPISNKPKQVCWTYPKLHTARFASPFTIISLC